MASLTDLLDYVYGGASGINKSVLGAADTLVGNPLAGLANFATDAGIERNPVTRYMQGVGVGNDPANERQAVAQGITRLPAEMAIGSVPIAGDISGLVQDVNAMRAGDIEITPATVGLTLAGLLPLVPPASRYLMDRLPDGALDSTGPIEAQRGHWLWHGTPNEWNPEPGFPDGRPRFDKGTALTGEGTNIHGAGLYAGEERQVGESYMALAGGEPLRYIDKKRGDVIPRGTEEYERLLSTQRRMASNGYSEKFASQFDWDMPGNLYKIDFPDEMLPDVLDLHSPISAQSAKVNDAADAVRQKLANDLAAVKSEVVASAPEWGDMGSVSEMAQSKADRIAALESAIEQIPSMTGAELVNKLEVIHGSPEAASAYLLSRGVPGSRHLDSGSRNDGGKTGGEGTYNYVLFAPQEHVKHAEKVRRE